MGELTIKDIARAIHVSHSTVSRALNHNPIVRPETAARIHELARKMDYRPSAVGRSLVTRRTRTIGIVVTSIADPFNADVVSEVESLANQHGYSILLANSDDEPERELSVVHSFQERRVDGILVMASRVGTLYASLLSKTTVPIVLVNSQQGGGRLHSVAIDNVTSARKATAHLIELGHRRIAYIGNQARVQADPERAAGYRQALREAGLRPRRNLVAFGDGKPEGGLEAMGKLLELPEPPTAVFCYNDMSAFGALRMIQKSGLRVPHDISIVGFDDLSLASYMNPPLTTIRQPRREMGRRATEILLKLFEGSRSRNAVRFEGELVVRESTAASPPSRKLSPRH